MLKHWHADIQRINEKETRKLKFCEVFWKLIVSKNKYFENFEIKTNIYTVSHSHTHPYSVNGNIWNALEKLCQHCASVLSKFYTVAAVVLCENCLNCGCKFLMILEILYHYFFLLMHSNLKFIKLLRKREKNIEKSFQVH